LKRVLPVAFAILLLCSLILIANVGIIEASEPGYEVS